jgi:hypothetical protein
MRLSSNADLVAVIEIVLTVQWGYGRLVTYAIEDSGGNVLNKGKFTVSEDVTAVSSNPQQRNMYTAVVRSKIHGAIFYDGLFFGFPDAPGPVPGQFLKRKQAINVFAKAAAYLGLRVNCIDQEYNNATVTDVTLFPQATCQ